jgi:hypothetical protein
MSKKFALETLQKFAIGDQLYVLGTYERGVTIYNQQVRALNLAWALCEALKPNHATRVCVIGGGIGGVTLATALSRRLRLRIALFEKRPVLCPLQQGSEARWVHPHIYDWPSPHSEMPSASLPLLNWNAGRASDVAAQILTEYSKLKMSSSIDIDERLNTKYLRVDEGYSITWSRSPAGTRIRSLGAIAQFDVVILALGFGEESDGEMLEDASIRASERAKKVSYWRNETLSQPQLELGVRTYLISGYGDGALVDLFRARISNFRQDRILKELFEDRPQLLGRLQEFRNSNFNPDERLIFPGLKSVIDSFPRESATKGEYRDLVAEMRARLRSDTQVVLLMRKNRGESKASIEDILSHASSFQNKVLFYLLFKLGGFIPSHQAEKQTVLEYGINFEDVIRRHGTNREAALVDVLCPSLIDLTLQARADMSSALSQPSEPLWPGGYWDEAPLPASSSAADAVKRSWRKEYLPAATETVAMTFAATVAAAISDRCGDDFRVVFHRIIGMGHEVLYQQCSHYYGQGHRYGLGARTFSVRTGTVGLSYRTRALVRSKIGASRIELQGDMDRLDLKKASQVMSNAVQSLVTIPFMAGDECIGVLYADSTVSRAFPDDLISRLLSLCHGFAGHLDHLANQKSMGDAGLRVRNYERTISHLRHLGFESERREKKLLALEEVPAELPTLNRIRSVNFELLSPLGIP